MAEDVVYLLTYNNSIKIVKIFRMRNILHKHLKIDGIERISIEFMCLESNAYLHVKWKIMLLKCCTKYGGQWRCSNGCLSKSTLLFFNIVLPRCMK